MSAIEDCDPRWPRRSAQENSAIEIRITSPICRTWIFQPAVDGQLLDLGFGNPGIAMGFRNSIEWIQRMAHGNRTGMPVIHACKDINRELRGPMNVK